MKACDALIAWTPDRGGASEKYETRGCIQVGPVRGDRDQNWEEPYQYFGGAKDPTWQKYGDETYNVMKIFIEFHLITVRDNIDPQKVHREFLKIDEYRKYISLDIAGAES